MLLSPTNKTETDRICQLNGIGYRKWGEYGKRDIIHQSCADWIFFLWNPPEPAG